MSSLASLFNSSAMLFTVDFYKKYRPNAPEKQLVRVGRIATAVIVVLGILWIPVMKGMGQVLYQYLQDVQSLLAPGIAAVFLLGVVSKKTTPAAGYWGLVIGFFLGMMRLAMKIFASSFDPNNFFFKFIVAPNWLHYEIALFIVIILLMVIISYFTEGKDPAKIKGLYFRSSSPEEVALTRASWNKWDVINSLIVIAFIIGFYIYFW